MFAEGSPGIGFNFGVGEYEHRSWPDLLRREYLERVRC